VQLEGNITEKLSTSLAARHEHYSDFGSTTSFAISGRYDFSPQFAIRGSASSGFRAPSLGQQHYSETTSAAQGPGNSLGLPPGIYLRGLVPVSNPIAMLLGAEPLEPETSRNYTAGFVWRPSAAFDTTVDIYQIMLHNRIALSSQISLALPSVIDYLAANGITNLQYSGISYFTNAGNVKTRGIDVVSTYRHTFDNGGSLLTTLGATYHKNKVSGVRPNPEVLDALGAIFQRLNRSAILGLLADTMPRSKIILTSTYNLGNWGVTGTATRYGKFTSFGATSPVDDVTYPGKWIFDLAVNYYRDNWTFTLGSDNVFNTYPKRVPEDDDNNGVFPYSSSSPFGFEGSFIYAKMGYRW
jgi:iron complex outermembrane receptor protein